jgi:hypothetical protein
LEVGVEHFAWVLRESYNHRLHLALLSCLDDIVDKEAVTEVYAIEKSDGGYEPLCA